MPYKKRKLCSRKKRLGATTVEMAVVLPVFLAILFGFIEISRLSFAVNTTTVALIKATRELSLPNATAEDGKNAAKELPFEIGVCRRRYHHHDFTGNDYGKYARGHDGHPTAYATATLHSGAVDDTKSRMI